MLVTLFAREHNAICDRLRREYPQWSDEELFQRARLVNAALLAKIHTVEWTPAVISHPTTVTALRANWFGLAGERRRAAVRPAQRQRDRQRHPRQPRPTTTACPTPSPRSSPRVYRMHPLLRDDWTLRRVADDEVPGELHLRRPHRDRRPTTSSASTG